MILHWLAHHYDRYRAAATKFADSLGGSNGLKNKAEAFKTAAGTTPGTGFQQAANRVTTGGTDDNATLNNFKGAATKFNATGTPFKDFGDALANALGGTVLDSLATKFQRAATAFQTQAASFNSNAPSGPITVNGANAKNKVDTIKTAFNDAGNSFGLAATKLYNAITALSAGSQNPTKNFKTNVAAFAGAAIQFNEHASKIDTTGLTFTPNGNVQQAIDAFQRAATHFKVSANTLNEIVILMAQ